MKNFGEILNFSANFSVNFSKFFKSLWWVDLCCMFSSNRNFGDAIAVQDLKGIHVWNFFWCSLPPTPPPKILAPPLYTVYILYIYVHLCPPKFLYVADPMQYIYIYIYMSYWEFDNRWLSDNYYWKFDNGYCAIIRRRRLHGD